MTNTTTNQVLVDAARLAQHAPSILNTQPWRWRARGATMELLADRSRHIRSIDPDGRMLTISCGAALHHARALLAAAGCTVSVHRFPEPADPDLLARLGPVETGQSAQPDVETIELIRQRHTDRRPFAANIPVPVEALESMSRAAEAEDAWLYEVAQPQLASLATAAETAASAEASMENYQAELYEWTHRPRASGDGVRIETVTADMPRAIHLRDFAPGRETLLDPGFGDDRFAEFLILATANDTPLQWLRAGEATSAAWLAATAAGLVASVMSDIIEVPEARRILRTLLHSPGQPQLVFRVGFNMQPPLPTTSPRRPAADVIDQG